MCDVLLFIFAKSCSFLCALFVCSNYLKLKYIDETECISLMLINVSFQTLRTLALWCPQPTGMFSIMVSKYADHDTLH